MTTRAPCLDAQPIYFRIAPDERERLERLQERLGLTLSQTVRLAVRDGLDALERSTTRVRRGAGVLAALARTRR